MRVHAWCILGLALSNLVTYSLYFPHARTQPEYVCHSKGYMCTHMPTASVLFIVTVRIALSEALCYSHGHVRIAPCYLHVTVRIARSYSYVTVRIATANILRHSKYHVNANGGRIGWQLLDYLAKWQVV